jgi:hypothetical protein
MSVKRVLMRLPHEHTLPDASDYHHAKYILAVVPVEAIPDKDMLAQPHKSHQLFNPRSLSVSG